MFYIRQWLEDEAKKHDSEWANDVIRTIRWNSRPLINLEHAQKGMAYLMGTQDMSPIRNKFLDPQKINLTNSTVSAGGVVQGAVDNDKVWLKEAMVGVEFKSLPIMEKLRAILTAEMKKMGVIVNVKAEDPTSTVARENDKALIKKRKNIESLLRYIYGGIGEEPVTLDQHEERFGEKVGSGNVQDFDAMGFEEQDPQDVKTFFDNFHKLNWEIEAQQVINYFMKFNEVEESLIDNWVTDIIAKKATAAQAFVSETTGAVRYQYIAPETVFIYGGGRRKDYNDANAKGFQITITIKEMLERIGNSFDFEAQWNNLLIAVQYGQGVEITGIGADPQGGWYCESKQGVRYTRNDFMQFKVNFGYVEWSTQEHEETEQGLPKQMSGAFYQDNQPGNGERYQKKAAFETPTYKANYLAISAYEQILFNFGKMSYQDIEGYSDFNSNFSIITYKEIGESLSLVCAPYIDLINECWYNFKHEVRRAKPRGRGWNYQGLIAMAQEMFADENIAPAGKVQKMMQLLDQSANELYSYPELNGNEVPIPGNQMNYDIPNGLSKEVMMWWETMNATWQKMLDTAGISPLREGDPGGPRDSMNNQFKALEYSQASTYYLPNTVTYICQQLASKTMMFVQDIIHFKTIDTMAYKFLSDAVGEETLNVIYGMGKKAMHRYGVFVESMNLAPMKAKLDAVLQMAVQKGTLTTSQYLLIDQIQSPSKAFKVLAYMEQRNQKIASQQAMALQQQQGQQAMAIEEAKKQNILLEGQLKIQQEEVKGQYLVKAHTVGADAGIIKTDMKLSGDAMLAVQAARLDIEKTRAEVNGLGNVPMQSPQSNQPMQSMPPKGMPPQEGTMDGLPANPEESVRQQLRQKVEPQPTGY